MTAILAAGMLAVGVSGCTSEPAISTERSGSQAAPSRRASAPTQTPSARPTPSGVSVDLIRSGWTDAIERLVEGRDVSVAVGLERHIVYLHEGAVQRIEASNAKLLTSMAVLDTFGAGFRIPTIAAGRALRGGVLHGDLWIEGAGDPELSETDLAALAARLWTAGLRRVTGSVLGDTGAFTREWWAPGWVPGLSRRYVERTTALAIDGNQVQGQPERVAAAALTGALIRLGVAVQGSPGSGVAPPGMDVLASVRSDPLREILVRQNHDSVNFDAEMLTKALGAKVSGAPGSTASGAAAIEAWARLMGVRAHVRDGSGLSHQDTISVAGMVTLLLEAARRSWGEAFWASLPAAGDGTLAGRLPGSTVRAKTGTLFETPVSALSGYVDDAGGSRVAFSVLSRGLDKDAAVAIEDAIVRILATARLG